MVSFGPLWGFVRSNLTSWRSKPSERHFCLFEIGRRDQRSSTKYPVFLQVLGRVKHIPAFPSMIRACYGRCESLTTFQCQVVENEAWPQTDGSLELPPVRGGDKSEEIPTTGDEREMLMRRACASTAHEAFSCWSTAFSPHPARSAEWPHGPCLAPAPCIPESSP